MNRILIGRVKLNLLQSAGRLLWIGLVMGAVGCATTTQSTVPPKKTSETMEQRTVEQDEPTEQKTSPPKVPEVTPPKSIAAWVPKGSGAFTIDTQRVFHGIGGSVSSSNPILLRASADNRSREELTVVLSQFITFVTHTYWNQAGGRESSDVGNLRLLNDTFTAVAKESLTASRIAGHWQNPESGEFFSLCRLPLSDLVTAVGSDTRLDQRSRDFFLQNAEKLYDQFSRESGVEAS